MLYDNKYIINGYNRYYFYCKLFFGIYVRGIKYYCLGIFGVCLLNNNFCNVFEIKKILCVYN